MVNINHILSGQSGQIHPISRTEAPSSGSSPQTQDKSVGLHPDRFTTDQPWKNKATATELSGSGCRCGSCAKCGADAYGKQQAMAEGTGAESATGKSDQITQDTISLTAEKGPTGERLQPEQVAQINELKKIDQKVRAHEQAHMGAAGGLATSGISLSYAKGPDGQKYAVGGEVSIDTSAASTPSETIAKMMKVRAAALAPSDPSSQDRKVAAAASVVMGEARAQLQIEERGGGEQVVERAGQQIVENRQNETRGDTALPVQSGGSYQRSQYQKAAVGTMESLP